MTTARKLFLTLLGLDALSVLVAFNLLSILRGLEIGEHWVVAPLLAPLAALVFALYLIDGYSPRADMISLDYTSLHTIAMANALLATLLMTYVIMPSGYELQSSRVVIALSYVVLVPVTLSYRRLLYQRSATMRGTRTLVFLGDAVSCRDFHEECARIKYTQPIIYAMVSMPSRAPWKHESPLELHAFVDVLEEIRHRRLPVEAIILRESGQDLPAKVSRELVELYFSGTPTYTLELFHQVYWRKIPLYRLNQTWLFQEGFQIAREPVFERLKRAGDIAFGLLGLVVTAPLILLGAAAVRLEDGGSAFFVQVRVGKNHVPFRLFKLRTMRPSQNDDEPYTKPDDQRITRVGRYLRATRVDELPQLWNVVRGDMSLIGPRAEWSRLVESYEREIPCYHFRHLVKPGITGWAQVNYPYGASIDDTVRKLEYDLFYIRHFSFVLDASIVLKTIHVMLFGKGR